MKQLSMRFGLIINYMFMKIKINQHKGHFLQNTNKSCQHLDYITSETPTGYKVEFTNLLRSVTEQT